MKKLTVKRLDVMSVANFTAMLFAAVSLVTVVLGWILAFINYSSLKSQFPNLVDWNTGVGILAIIFVPIIYLVVGWIVGAIIAWFYNVALGASNGIKIDVEE